MKDVGIYSKKDFLASQLSGGYQRKLSAGIAFVGGSKLIILDEPTSSLDLEARRKIWNMVKEYKKDRILLLTTHYMDEADILGDRIGVMSGGKMTALGSSMYLKKAFGAGYNFTCVKLKESPDNKIHEYFVNFFKQDV
jgi:ATP-binding cassette subfamily A (ABC1) protein 3